MFSLKICKCQKKSDLEFRQEVVFAHAKCAYGPLELAPFCENGTPFCKCCNRPSITEKEARSLIKNSLEKVQSKKGFLSGVQVLSIRTKMNLSLREFGRLIDTNYGLVSAIENGYFLQSERCDLAIRKLPMKIKLKRVFSHMIQMIGTSKLFLNKMMFYVDFWNFKKTGQSLTGAKYIPLQYGPCPVGYQNIIDEMVEDGEITPTEGHKFRVNKTPDMSEFSVEEMVSINDIIKLAKHDKGQKLFDLSHEERGFIETPYYETISYEKYAKDLRIEELLNKINETG